MIKEDPAGCGAARPVLSSAPSWPSLALSLQDERHTAMKIGTMAWVDLTVPDAAAVRDFHQVEP